jgi:hypothetical protein
LPTNSLVMSISGSHHPKILAGPGRNNRMHRRRAQAALVASAFIHIEDTDLRVAGITVACLGLTRC